MCFACWEGQDLGGHADECEGGVWGVEDVLVEMMNAFAGCDYGGSEGGEEGVGVEVAGAEEDLINISFDKAIGEAYGSFDAGRWWEEFGDLG